MKPDKKSAVRQSAVSIIRKNKFLTVMLIFTILADIAASLLPPLVLESIINTLTGSKTVGLCAAMLYFALISVSGIMDTVQNVLITKFGQKITHEMRSIAINKLKHLPASYFTNEASGKTVSLFVNDIDAVGTLFDDGIISMFADACKITGILVVIFTKSLGLGTLLLLITPLLFMFTRIVQKRMLAAQFSNRAAIAKVNNHVPETISNLEMIHTLAREEYMQKLYDALIDESYASVDKVNFYNSVYSPVIVVSSCAVISMMMLFAAMGGEVQKFFGLTVGSAIAIISYVGKIFTPLEDIGMEIENIQAAMAGIERVNIFLNENERMMPSISVKSFTQDRIKADENKLPALELRNVNFSYVKGEPVIQGLSLSVMPSENVTLAGRTGIGKSTVFKLIMGLYVPDSGEVLVFGTNASDIADRGKRRLFGYVEQNLSIIQGSFGEQVSLMDAGINSYDIMKALDIVGLKETVGKLPDGIDTPFEKCALSQGQLQLLSIARAITYNPKILLLDEITANLDSGTEKMVMDALKRASTNRTVISISHRLYESEHNGRLIEIV